MGAAERAASESTMAAGIFLRPHRSGTWPWGGPQFILHPAGDPTLPEDARPENRADAGKSETIGLFIENMPWSAAVIFSQAALLVAALWVLISPLN